MTATSDFEKSRKIWQQEFTISSLLWDSLNELPFTIDKHMKDPNSGIQNPEFYLTNFKKYFEHLDISSKRRFKRLLLNRIKSLMAGNKPTKSLINQADKLSKLNMTSLAAIPNSLEKAKGCLMALIDTGLTESDQVYDAYCLLHNHVKPEDKLSIIKQWDDEFNLYLEEEGITINGDTKIYPNKGPYSYIFWRSRIENQILDLISRYRFIHTFNIDYFPETFKGIESIFDEMFINKFEENELHILLYDTWVASRSSKLCNKIRYHLDSALIQIADNLTEGGWWHSGISNNNENNLLKPIPDVYRTALSCVVLLRLARFNAHLNRAIDGVKWLAKKQQSSGAWLRWLPRDFYEDLTLIQKPDLFTTILASEAIRLSSLKGYEHTLLTAESWIMDQQNADGIWVYEGFPFPFMTVLVIEYYELTLKNSYDKINKHLISQLDNTTKNIETNGEIIGSSDKIILLSGYRCIKALVKTTKTWEEFTFNETQAKIVEALHKALNHELHSKFILEEKLGLVLAKYKIGKYFRNHKTWRNLIVSSNKKGFWYLNI